MLTAEDRAQIRDELDPAQQAERWRSLALRLLNELEAAESKRGDDNWAQENNKLRTRLEDYIERHKQIELVCIKEGMLWQVSVLDEVKALADSYRAEKERADRLQADLECLGCEVAHARTRLLKAGLDCGNNEVGQQLAVLIADRDRLRNEVDRLYQQSDEHRREVYRLRGVLDMEKDAHKSALDRNAQLRHEVEQLRAARESLEPVGWMVASGTVSPLLDEPVWGSRNVERNTKRRVYLAPPQPLEDAE